jgi:hypothetical protein
LPKIVDDEHLKMIDGKLISKEPSGADSYANKSMNQPRVDVSDN